MLFLINYINKHKQIRLKKILKKFKIILRHFKQHLNPILIVSYANQNLI